MLEGFFECTGKYKGETVALVSHADFGLILNCAVRYAMGRMTYVPRSVINYIIPMIQDIGNRTLDCFIRDIELYDEDVNRGIGSWGADFDKADWMRFLEVCRKENEHRKNESKRH